MVIQTSPPTMADSPMPMAVSQIALSLTIVSPCVTIGGHVRPAPKSLAFPKVAIQSTVPWSLSLCTMYPVPRKQAGVPLDAPQQAVPPIAAAPLPPSTSTGTQTQDEKKAHTPAVGVEAVWSDTGRIDPAPSPHVYGLFASDHVASNDAIILLPFLLSAQVLRSRGQNLLHPLSGDTKHVANLPAACALSPHLGHAPLTGAALRNPQVVLLLVLCHARILVHLTRDCQRPDKRSPPPRAVLQHPMMVCKKFLTRVVDLRDHLFAPFNRSTKWIETIWFTNA